MNNCPKYRDWIITDYLDGELSKEQSVDLEEHLRVCADCRGFAEEAQKHLKAPFEQAGRQAVPEHLWGLIKQKIEPETRQDNPLKEFIERLREALVPARLVPAMAALSVMIIIGSFVVRSNQLEYVQKQEQVEYLASMLGNGDATLETENPRLGTSI